MLRIQKCFNFDAFEFELQYINFHLDHSNSFNFVKSNVSVDVLVDRFSGAILSPEGHCSQGFKGFKMDSIQY